MKVKIDGLNKLVLLSCAFCSMMVMSIQLATTVSESQAIPFQGKMNHTPVDPCQWTVSVILNDVYIALESYFMVSKRNQFTSIQFVTMTKKKDNSSSFERNAWLLISSGPKRLTCFAIVSHVLSCWNQG
jgi:hypothetical protein